MHWLTRLGLLIGIILVMEGWAQAQSPLTIGNPYLARGYSTAGIAVNNSSFGGFVSAPTMISYPSGYRSYLAPRPVNPTGYQNRPYYGAYGYGNYSNGSTDGFPPFRGRSRRTR